ncbi:LLM class F420-dependent oxidoreductase [Streptomyces sp. NBC_01643]|uniref:LLM class F420-dependent oxidoreductase n=1 Tax=Streptomyces sp. NBC_01643 TaxID=2975906 RepID=UPI002F907FAE|nr:LLM class F420-dependent oxidoreductase [Streptomyces sp. NBC_01643]
MRIGMQLNYQTGFIEAVEELRDFERAGLGIAFVSELYGFDAISQLGYIAAKTETVEIASGIIPIYSRTPTLTAMTAAGLDFVSGGRFTLGLGASGPQVIEGFHGVSYDAPLGRTREVVEICRKIWLRDPLVHNGKNYQIPLPPGSGTGLGKPLKLINHLVRDRVPIIIAAMGPKNVALAAEIAEGWEPIFFHPGKASEIFGESLAQGKSLRDPQLGELQICVEAPVAIDGNLDAAIQSARERLALYIGGMGAKGKNFYNDLACRYGYEREAKKIQDLYLGGRKKEAVASVPEELVRAVSLIGSADEVKNQISDFAEAGVTTLTISPVGLDSGDRAGRIRLVEKIVTLANQA